MKPSLDKRKNTQSAKLRCIAGMQVILASLLMLATLPGRTQGLGLVTEPLLADLHLERVMYASMNLWATLLGALLCLPTGWVIDRIGLRWVTGAVVLVLGVTVWQLSATTSSLALIFILLLSTRAFGQSALSVCSIATVGKWFPQRAGLAMGVYSVLVSVFFAVAFGVIGYLVRAHGWRSAWLDSALVLLFVVLPLVLIALREPISHADSPPATGAAFVDSTKKEPGSTDSDGALPVEHPSPGSTMGQAASYPSRDFTLAQAIGTGAFWLFAGAAAGFNLVSSGFGLFNEAILVERGFDRKTFHIFLALSSLMSLGGQFACGWLTRRYRYQNLTCLALLLYALSLAVIPLITQHWQLWCLAVLFGVAGGMIIVIFFSVWVDLFGARHLGRIQGAAQMVTVLSSALGPLVFARSVQRSGSYAPLLFALAGLSLLLSLLAGFVPSPIKQRTGISAQGD